MILETEGYWVKDFPRKGLADILRANLVAVEYRFYGDSLTERDIPWQYLTVEQAAADHHRIVALFKRLYSGPWVSSGFSKGGESALIHRRYYPDDVQATVVYDALLILGTEDERVDRFIRDRIDNSGQCGRELVSFQRELLEKREELIPELKARAVERNSPSPSARARYSSTPPWNTPSVSGSEARPATRFRWKARRRHRCSTI